MATTASKFVILALFGYLISRIVISVIKLQNREIGTKVTRRNSDPVTFPTMTFCSLRNKEIYMFGFGDQGDQEYKGRQGDLGSTTGSLTLMSGNENFVNFVQFHLQNETTLDRYQNFDYIHILFW